MSPTVTARPVGPHTCDGTKARAGLAPWKQFAVINSTQLGGVSMKQINHEQPDEILAVFSAGAT